MTFSLFFNGRIHIYMVNLNLHNILIFLLFLSFPLFFSLVLFSFSLFFLSSFLFSSFSCYFFLLQHFFFFCSVLSVAVSFLRGFFVSYARNHNPSAHTPRLPALRRSLREKSSVELTNPDWLGDETIPSEFGLRRRTKPGTGVTGGVVVGGVDTSLPSAPLLASLRAIQVIMIMMMDADHGDRNVVDGKLIDDDQ